MLEPVSPSGTGKTFNSSTTRRYLRKKKVPAAKNLRKARPSARETVHAADIASGLRWATSDSFGWDCLARAAYAIVPWLSRLPALVSTGVDDRGEALRSLWEGSCHR